MSAEPARTGPDDGPGIVLHFRRSPMRPVPRREAPVPDTGDTTPQRRLAHRIEELFLKHDGRTLTDPETAQVFLITLSLVADLLEGAHNQGLYDDHAYQELHAMIEGMSAAPALISGDV